MKKSIWHIKIPTLAGLFLLFITVAITVLFVQNNPLFNIRANPSITPAFVRISNITDTSFTVSYVTTIATSGTISYGETTAVGQVVLDDRDENVGGPANRYLHYFTVTNNKPSTKYFFTILSNNQTFTDQDQPYTVTTGVALPANTINPRSLNGSVIMPDGTSPKEAVVFMQLPNSQVLSVPVQNSGAYSFNLTTLRNQNLDQYAQVTDTDQVSLTYIGDGNEASATTLLKDASPVPPVTLSQQYSFITDTTLTPTTTASGSAQPTIPQLKKPQADKLEIIVPSVNQAFNDRQPEFSGTALPNNTVTITIQSAQSANDIESSVQSDEYGEWSFRPTKPLDPGIYTLSAASEAGSDGISNVGQSFAINADGSGFTEPSVSPLKPSPSLTPTEAVPTVALTIIPTLSPSPTVFIPTATPIVIPPTIILSPQPSIVAVGSNEIVVSFGFISFALIAGALLFFLFRV